MSHLRLATAQSFSSTETWLLFESFAPVSMHDDIVGAMHEDVWHRTMGGTPWLREPVLVTKDHPFAVMMGSVHIMPSQRDAHVASSFIAWVHSENGRMLTDSFRGKDGYQVIMHKSFISHLWSNRAIRPVTARDQHVAQKTMDWFFTEDGRRFFAESEAQQHMSRRAHGIDDSPYVLQP